MWLTKFSRFSYVLEHLITILIIFKVEQVRVMQKKMQQSKRETIFRENSDSGQPLSSTSGHPWPLRWIIFCDFNYKQLGKNWLILQTMPNFAAVVLPPLTGTFTGFGWYDGEEVQDQMGELHRLRPPPHHHCPPRWPVGLCSRS